VLEDGAVKNRAKLAQFNELITTYVQKAEQLCHALHSPIDEDRKFKDDGKVTLGDILEPNARKLKGMAVCRLTPLEIATLYHYTCIFATPTVQKYLEMKWVGGSELRTKIDTLAVEVQPLAPYTIHSHHLSYTLVYVLVGARAHWHRIPQRHWRGYRRRWWK
jgi:hypothetical protein